MLQKKSFNIREDKRFHRHLLYTSNLLPNKENRGYYALCSITLPPKSIPIERLKSTFLSLDLVYSEALSHSSLPVTHSNGYSRIYQTKDENAKSVNSQITTCYLDGLIVTDGYIDIFCEGQDGLNPNWMFYKIQRHLQLSGEVFQDYVDKFLFVMILENIDIFKWEIFRHENVFEKMPYTGYHDDICSEISMSEIHSRDKWNRKMDIVEPILTEVARIFGMDSLPQKYWLENGELDYSSGMPGR